MTEAYTNGKVSWVRVAMLIYTVFLMCGPLTGIQGIFAAVARRGVFADKCNGGSSDASQGGTNAPSTSSGGFGCHEQEQAIAAVGNAEANFTNAIGIFVGFCVDIFGPYPTAIVGAVCWLLGIAVSGIAPHSGVAFTIGIMIAAFGASLAFFPLAVYHARISIGGTNMKALGVLLAVFSGCWDFGSVIMYLIAMLLDHTSEESFPLWALFLVYAGLGSVSLFGLIFLFPSSAVPAEVEADVDAAEAQASAAATAVNTPLPPGTPLGQSPSQDAAAIVEGASVSLPPALSSSIPIVPSTSCASNQAPISTSGVRSPPLLARVTSNPSFTDDVEGLYLTQRRSSLFIPCSPDDITGSYPDSGFPSPSARGAKTPKALSRKQSTVLPNNTTTDGAGEDQEDETLLQHHRLSCTAKVAFILKRYGNDIKGFLVKPEFWVVNAKALTVVGLGYVLLDNIGPLVRYRDKGSNEHVPEMLRNITLMMGGAAIFTMIPGRLQHTFGPEKGGAMVAFMSPFMLLLGALFAVTINASPEGKEYQNNYGAYFFFLMWRVVGYAIINVSINIVVCRDGKGIGTAFGAVFTIAGVISMAVGEYITDYMIDATAMSSDAHNGDDLSNSSKTKVVFMIWILTALAIVIDLIFAGTLWKLHRKEVARKRREENEEQQQSTVGGAGNCDDGPDVIVVQPGKNQIQGSPSSADVSGDFQRQEGAEPTEKTSLLGH